VKKWLIVIHRSLAIALCVPFLVWFASGIAMIYAGGMPELSPVERLQRIERIDLHRVRLSPVDAAAHARIDGDIGRVVLLMIVGRPAYRFYATNTTTVFADTGEPFQPIDAAGSLRVAASFVAGDAERLTYIRTLHAPDQWTIRLGGALPLHKIEVGDNARTELYVSSPLGEVVMVTDRRSRALAWVAAIPHWFYLTALRVNDRAWRAVVLSASALGIVVTLAGLTLGFVQYRSHYVGLMRWHYRAGAIFGVFAFTWVFSGWLSMQPWDWASPSRLGSAADRALRGGPLDVTRFHAFDAGAWSRLLDIRHVKEIELSQTDGKPQYVVWTADATRFVLRADPLERRRLLEPKSIVARFQDTFPAVPIADSDVLADYDSYYRDRNRRAPLPVVRMKLGDADRTWLYIDLATGAIAGQFTRRQRIERWTYHGLHSLDFPFWYDKRPLWDAAVIALCSGGLALSMIGTLLAVRRMSRRLNVRRF
jgi:hypothetical protein